jgi:hypothetical protein
VSRRLDAVEDTLEVERVPGADLQEVVGLAGDVVAVLDLGDRGEVAGQVGRHGPGRLGDPDEGEDPVAGETRVDDRAVAADEPAGLELLDPLVGRGPADPDLGAELGIRPAAVRLEQLDEPGVDEVGPVTFGHDSLSIRYYRLAYYTSLG